jgi:hypothetical protein
VDWGQVQEISYAYAVVRLGCVSDIATITRIIPLTNISASTNLDNSVGKQSELVGLVFFSRYFVLTFPRKDAIPFAAGSRFMYNLLVGNDLQRQLASAHSFLQAPKFIMH